MADVPETVPSTPDNETQHPEPENVPTSSDVADSQSRPQRERHPTAKALYGQVESAKKTLHQCWAKALDGLEGLRDAPDNQSAINPELSAVRSAMKLYKETWLKLEQLFGQDRSGEHTEDARNMKTAFLENTNYASDIISQATERLYQLALETKSNASGQSSSSQQSMRSATSSILSARTQAAASAAAAAQNAAYEEVIAKRTADITVMRTRSEAERRIEQARQEMEQQTRLATAEADLRILRARQAAAVEKARSDAFLQAEQELNETVTSPSQTSNDHAVLFCNPDKPTEPTPSPQLRPTAQPFQPSVMGNVATLPFQSSDDHAVPFCNPIDKPMEPPPRPQLRPTDQPFQPSVLSSVAAPPVPTYSNDTPNVPKPSLPFVPAKDENPLFSLTQQISDTLARQRQPTHEPDVYDGNPIMFQPWRCAFETMVNHAHTPATQRLTFLAKYSKGEVRKLVDRFRHRYISDPETAYTEAWVELTERFGNKTNISAAIIQKLNAFPKIRPEERRQLQGLADLCADAAAQMNDLPDLNILNYAHNLHPILEKLPTFLHNSWRKQASDFKSTTGSYPPFTELAKFLKQKARLHNDPELYPSSLPSSEKSRTNQGHRSSLKVLATSTPTKSTPASQAVDKCLYHGVQGHHLSECIAFGRKPIKERREFCKAKGLCYKCGNNHRIKDCDSKVKCRKCQSTEHASFMHISPKQNGGETSQGSQVDDSKTTEDTNTKCTRFLTCPSSKSCSKIVLCKIYHKDDPSKSILGYVVLDDQSNACLADPEVFDALDIQGPSLPYELSTCGGDRITAEGRRANGLIVESTEGRTEQLPTVIENAHIPGDKEEIPQPDICKRFPHLQPLSGKIPSLRSDVNIILLIGRNCPEPLKIRESRNGPKGTPWAQRTDLGWTISGQVCMSGAKGKVHASVKRTVLQPQPDEPDICENHIHVRDILSPCPQNKIIADVYEETPEDDMKAMSIEDRRFLSILTEGAHTNKEGNLEFPLPFKKEQPALPDNRLQAQSRLESLLRTLKRKPQMMSEYTAFFDKILHRNHASRVPEDELKAQQGMVWYLPHFAVHHPKKDDIRVVFDASVEYKGASLNKALLQGPDLMNNLLGILLRFRLGNVAAMGDVEQMFHNFHVNPEHRNFLRFLWFADNDPAKPIVEYRMNVHLFGSISSPAVATFGLRMVANNCRPTHGDDVVEFINRDFYVDDGLTSQPDKATTISLIERTRDALATKNLRFHKIASNKKEVMTALPEEARAKDLQNLDLNHDLLPTQRSLGVHWSLEHDTFTFKISLPDKPFSRRGVLSVTSSIYDPMGFIAPVTIEGKCILRQLISEMKNEPKEPQDIWDRPLPEKHRPRWTRWHNSLHHLETLHIQRCFHPPEFGPIKRREVHIFSDASDNAIAAVAYLRQIDEHDQPHVSFLLAKARVTPKHAVSIPRLELCGAVLATTLAQTIKVEFKNRITIDDMSFYSDSKVVLGYISNESKRFHVYVANRIHKIHKMSNPDQWKHVSTHENPADIASRSVPAAQLSDTIWLKGPEFLWQNDLSPTEIIEIYPNGPAPLQDDPEVRKDATVLATDVADDRSRPISNTILSSERFSRFSTWNSLRRAVATLIGKVEAFKQRRINSDADGQDDTCKRNTPDQLRRAEMVILRAVQRDHFSSELASLKLASKGNQPERNWVEKKSPIYPLSPILDENGLIRVGGRLRRADLDLGGRHPILLPKGNHVSRLIVQHFHREVQHQGRHTTFAAVRSGGIWIVHAHNLVRSVIDQCTLCRRLRGKFTTQVMADLPKDRVEATPPFTNVGMDVFGPWPVITRKTRSSTSEAKRWAVIFTCLCIRAIHIEVIESLDTSSFISALRRFISIRGPVTRLRCDRGTNFIGAEGELNREKTAQYLATKNCEWVFNPPKASHFGGVWERQIQTVRRILDSMFAQLGRHQLTHEILVTFMAEASAIVNSRPITATSSDANDPLALTPSMLLTLKTQPPQPPAGDFVKEDLYGRQQWRRVQYLADQFWTRWRKEYLQSLQPRQKWVQQMPNLGVGDVVLFRQKEQPRNRWPLARVTRTHPSEDGKVRKVDVLTCIDGTQKAYLRPISELVLIEKASASN